MLTQTRQSELVEFYRQLALLIRSGLPLPESLASLGQSCEDAAFKAALAAIAADVGKGVPLARALEPHRRFFPPFHARLIAGGERAGLLPEVLNEVAQIARFGYSLNQNVKSLAAYPAFTIAFAVAVLLVMLRFFLPEMGATMLQIADAPLPLFAAFVFAVAAGVGALWPAIVIAYVAALAAVAWLFTESVSAQAALRRSLRWFPGAAGIALNLDLARLCGLWSVLMARSVPFDDILDISLEVSEDAGLVAALGRLRQTCGAGATWRDSVDAEGGLPDALRRVLVRAAEADLPRELAGQRDAYAERATIAANQAGLVWETCALLFMGLVVAGTILTMFLPLIQFYHVMAGGAP